ncbi:MAG: hypothetical protein OEN56_09655 [Gemmatimonadota bacterium]|nr:hypothetical protein [Gemmatimonadota bacterium]MDH3425020.1 hypothetical protein [Gemmatimonadota bacterium]
MRPRTAAVALAIVASVVAADLRGQDVPTVAVMDFSSFMMGEGGASVQLGKAISAMLVTELSGREGIRIVERARTNDLLREMGLNFSGGVDESAAIELGELLGVQYVLHGQVTSIVGNLRLDIRAVDVGTSAVVSTMKKSGRTTEIFSVVVDLADEFTQTLDLVPPSGRPEAESTPVAATIEFSRAVGMEDSGNVEQAIQHYEKALDIHPSHRAARRALERLIAGTPS